MKINTLIIPGIKFRKIKLFSPGNYKKHLYTIFLSLAVVSGVVIYSVNKNDFNSTFSGMFSEFCIDFTCSGKADIFFGLLKNMLPYIIIILLLSTSAVGDLLIYLLTFIKISGMSTYTAFLYTQYGIAGIKYIFTVFLPGKCIFIIAALILTDLCTKISRDYRVKNKLSESELKKAGLILLTVCFIVFISLFIDLVTISIFLPKSGILSFFG